MSQTYPACLSAIVLERNIQSFMFLLYYNSISYKPCMETDYFAPELFGSPG